MPVARARNVSHLFFLRLTRQHSLQGSGWMLPAVLGIFWVLAPYAAWSQGPADTATDKMVQPAPPPAPAKVQPEHEIIVETMASYGNYRIFASGRDCKLYMAGFEYIGHTWGHLLGGQLDYAAEVMPVAVLKEPTVSDIWGNALTKNREYVPGFAFAPLGFRLQWRTGKAIKPYLSTKGGMIAFPKKVLSSESTYESFYFHNGIGVQVRMSDRMGLRLGLFNDFHFSNAFMVPVNPGLDVMNATLALSYHFGGSNGAR